MTQDPPVPPERPDDPSSDPLESREDFRSQVHAARADLERQVQARKAQLDATNERIQERTGRNLIVAILIGLGLGALLLVSLLLLKELFMVFAGALFVLTAFELASALRKAGLRVPRAATLISAAVIVPASYYLDADGKWLVQIAGVVFVVAWRLIEAAVPARRVSGKALLGDLVASVMVQMYVVFLGSYAILLAAQPDGQWWLLASLIVVVAVDTGAYAAGLSFGKHPMVPTISPKKTWEGFAGAGVAAIVAGILLAIFMIHVPWWVGIIMGVVLLFTATIGDLTESLIKRDIGIKDMSSWLPGHGGFLDRLDSVLPSMCAAYAIYVIFQPLFF